MVREDTIRNIKEGDYFHYGIQRASRGGESTRINGKTEGGMCNKRRRDKERYAPKGSLPLSKQEKRLQRGEEEHLNPFFKIHKLSLKRCLVDGTWGRERKLNACVHPSRLGEKRRVRQQGVAARKKKRAGHGSARPVQTGALPATKNCQRPSNKRGG